MGVLREFEVAAKFYFEHCYAVCNIVLYCAAIYRFKTYRNGATSGPSAKALSGALVFRVILREMRAFLVHHYLVIV